MLLMNPAASADVLVTVLITAYQTRPEHLREAVISALDQRVPNLDVLVVDDGSAPPLRDLVSALGDARVRYHRMEHRGLPHALIEGMARARGRYVAILDHDDRLTPDSLRTAWRPSSRTTWASSMVICSSCRPRAWSTASNVSPT
jgi:cellulose synthase/poly-beta-1,6-N-acetylglucosamine synthase-like glycosyltransferase